MKSSTDSIKQQLINAFETEFSFIQEKFELFDLLPNGSTKDKKIKKDSMSTSLENTIIEHPGVYTFIGNNSIGLIGFSMHNSRARVLQHLEFCTQKNGYRFWNINSFENKSILLFNVKKSSDKHWLLALESFLENKFSSNKNNGKSK